MPGRLCTRASTLSQPVVLQASAAAGRHSVQGRAGRSGVGRAAAAAAAAALSGVWRVGAPSQVGNKALRVFTRQPR